MTKRRQYSSELKAKVALTGRETGPPRRWPLASRPPAVDGDTGRLQDHCTPGDQPAARDVRSRLHGYQGYQAGRSLFHNAVYFYGTVNHIVLRDCVYRCFPGVFALSLLGIAQAFPIFKVLSPRETLHKSRRSCLIGTGGV